MLSERAPRASQRAAHAISRALNGLRTHPQAGRPVVNEDPSTAGLRELVAPFGDSGYVALYVIGPDAVVVLAFRHQREAGL